MERSGHVVEIPRKLTQRKAVTTVSSLAEIRNGYLSNTTLSVTDLADVFGVQFILQLKQLPFRKVWKFLR